MKYLKKDKALESFDFNELNNLDNYFKMLEKRGTERKNSLKIVKDYIGNISSKTAGKILDYGLFY
jgi:hypothetical protein